MKNDAEEIKNAGQGEPSPVQAEKFVVLVAGGEPSPNPPRKRTEYCVGRCGRSSSVEIGAEFRCGHCSATYEGKSETPKPSEPLLPCPFCKTHALQMIDGDVVCQGYRCHARMPNDCVNGETYYAMRVRWNRRCVPSPSPDAIMSGEELMRRAGDDLIRLRDYDENNEARSIEWDRTIWVREDWARGTPKDAVQDPEQDTEGPICLVFNSSHFIDGKVCGGEEVVRVMPTGECDIAALATAEQIRWALESVGRYLAKRASRGDSGEIQRDTAPWSGSWNNWIAPFHVCPRCRTSLDWKAGEDLLDRPWISARCCGLTFSAPLEFKSDAAMGSPSPSSAPKNAVLDTPKP